MPLDVPAHNDRVVLVVPQNRMTSRVKTQQATKVRVGMQPLRRNYSQNMCMGDEQHIMPLKNEGDGLFDNTACARSRFVDGFTMSIVHVQMLSFRKLANPVTLHDLRQHLRTFVPNAPIMAQHSADFLTLTPFSGPVIPFR